MDDIAFARLLQEWAAKQPGLRVTPSGYASWLTFSGLALRNGEALLQQTGGRWDSIRLMLHGLATLDIPPRYVSRDLVQAWLHTDTPTLTWNHPYVLPGYVLFFPLPVDPDQDWLKIQIREGPHTVCAVTVLSSNEGLAAIPIVLAEGMMQACDGVFIPPDTDANDPIHSGPGRLLAKLAINSWYTHLFEPALITTDFVKPARGSGFGRRCKEARSPIAPTWIGREFKLSKPSFQGEPSEDGRSVRPHWRSGHWHRVRHGKGREAIRLQWYRPVYVNADTAA